MPGVVKLKLPSNDIIYMFIHPSGKEGFHKMVTDSVSYWQRTSPSSPLASDMPRLADVVVIGGGLFGTSTAYWLAREGVRVVLLERNALAYGATGRNGGFVRAGSRLSYPEAIAHLGYDMAHSVMEITYGNQDLLRQVLQEEEIDCDYREPGALQLAITEAKIEGQHLEIAALTTDGYPARWLDRAQVQAMIATPLGPEILGGRFLPRQGLVHSARLVQGLGHAAQRHGARAYQADVHEVRREGDHVHLRTSQGDLAAQTVVVAANVWTGKLIPSLGRLIVPVLEQMQAYEALEPIFPMALSVGMNTGEYMQQTLPGNILIGGCGFVAPNAGVGVWESVPTEPVQEAIEQILPRLFPALVPRLRVIERWAGLLDCTTDEHPIVDEVPEVPGAFFVGGLSGHGMPFGLRFGQLLATAVTDGKLPEALAPFGLDRPSLKVWEI